MKSFLAPGLSVKLLSDKEYVKWFMKSWFASNVKVTMAAVSCVTDNRGCLQSVGLPANWLRS